MSIQVQCSQCGAIHQANDRLAGRHLRCPQCDSVVDVPKQTETQGEIEPAEAFESDSNLDAAATGHAVAFGGDTASLQADDTAAGVATIDQPDGAAPDAATTADFEEEDDEPVLQRKPRVEDELDMTPMVDVTFLLLIFFMVTASFSLQKSIEMPRQQTDAPSSNPDPEILEELESVEVQVDERGSFLVLAAEWEDETPGKQNLITALKKAMVGTGDGMMLIIKVHELAKLQFLVDAMDAGTIAGYSEIKVTQVDGFD